MTTGTGTIELRLVSDDSVVDSIEANELLVNVGDRREVSLTALTLPSSGHVYIYIPSGALVSQSSGMPFGGYTNSDDWDFTIGSVSEQTTTGRGIARASVVRKSIAKRRITRPIAR